MKQNCRNKCTISLIVLKNTSLYSTIDSFVNQIDVISGNSTSINEFYNFIKTKYNIPCESGMLFIEKLVMYNVFNKFKINNDSSNKLVNDKIILYQWIRPEHLEIFSISISNWDYHIKEFKEIEKSDVPSVKIFYLMKAIGNLYERIGKASPCDELMNALVYCFIKSKVKDIYMHIRFMKVFRRDFGGSCNISCTHGFNINVACDCLVSKDWSNEDKYYLLTCEAAVEYIRQMEYYNLNVKVKEFEKEITEKIEDLNLKDNPSSLDSFFEK